MASTIQPHGTELDEDAVCAVVVVVVECVVVVVGGVVVVVGGAVVVVGGAVVVVVVGGAVVVVVVGGAVVVVGWATADGLNTPLHAMPAAGTRAKTMVRNAAGRRAGRDRIGGRLTEDGFTAGGLTEGSLENRGASKPG
jgi:hypothetical protein